MGCNASKAGAGGVDERMPKPGSKEDADNKYFEA